MALESDFHISHNLTATVRETSGFQLDGIWSITTARCHLLRHTGPLTHPACLWWQESLFVFLRAWWLYLHLLQEQPGWQQTSASHWTGLSTPPRHRWPASWDPSPPCWGLLVKRGHEHTSWSVTQSVWMRSFFSGQTFRVSVRVSELLLTHFLSAGKALIQCTEEMSENMNSIAEG